MVRVIRDKLVQETLLHVDFLTVAETELTLEGYCLTDGSIDADDISICVTFNGVLAVADRVERHNPPAKNAGEGIQKLGFRVQVPLDFRHKTCYEVSIRTSMGSVAAHLEFGKFVALNESLPSSYLLAAGMICTSLREGSAVRGVVVEPASAFKRLWLEASLSSQVFSATHNVKLLGWRVVGHRMRAARERGGKLWLISDRPMKAGDNGEALFTWLCEHPIEGVEPVYALCKESEDWERMSKIGRVTDFGSREYQMLFLRADLVVSSAADEWVINAFGKRRPYLKDLYGFKFVFLQHGVTKDDISGWVNRYNKDIRLFVTSAQRERESIVNGPYGYDDQVVRQTGFPRHDSLLKRAESTNPQHVIYLLPTWRKYLVKGGANQRTGRNSHNEDFALSHYFKAYQDLISDETLNELLDSHGFEMRFVLHPSLLQEAQLFKPGTHIQVMSQCNYQEAFLDAALLITDYSSVAFDYALLKKPLIYYQFDQEEFFSGHFYDVGYFSYEADGFGPICITKEALLKQVSAYLEGDCCMESTYLKRVDAFFGRQPACRCEAVVKELMKL